MYGTTYTEIQILYNIKRLVCTLVYMCMEDMVNRGAAISGTSSRNLFLEGRKGKKTYTASVAMRGLLFEDPTRFWKRTLRFDPRRNDTMISRGESRWQSCFIPPR